MSSDSDDLDEDELLQMALKEQAQRDLDYTNTNSSNNNKKPRKPVVNYVQPPPQQPPKKPVVANANSRAGAARRPVVEEDDDSEVEMLSISSGDDDSSTKDQHPHRGSGVGGRGSLAQSRDDDVAAVTWDGDEPSFWKHVDEAEVSLSNWSAFVWIFYWDWDKSEKLLLNSKKISLDEFNLSIYLFLLVLAVELLNLFLEEDYLNGLNVA